MSKDALDGWRVDGKITATEQATQPGDVPILDSTGKIPDELINAVEVDDFYTESTDDDAVTMDENKVWRLNGWEGLEERVGDAEDDIDGLSTRMGTAETALNAKQAKLTFDSAPTAGSTNPVKSGGVYTALDAKADKTAVNNGLALKADKTAVNEALALKADKAEEKAVVTVTVTPMAAASGLLVRAFGDTVVAAYTNLSGVATLELDGGEYLVSVVAPAGYITPAPQSLTVVKSVDSSMNFSLATTTVTVTVVDSSSSGYQAGRTITATNGTDTVTGTTNASGVVNLTLNDVGTYTISTDLPTGATANPATVTTSGEGSYSATLTLRFGFTFSMTFNANTFKTDPTGCLAYAGDASGFTPLANTNTSLAAVPVSARGSWIKDTNKLLKKLYYATFNTDGTISKILNPDNLALDMDGNASDIATKNTMLVIPTLYTKGENGKITISDQSSEGTAHAHTIGGHVYDNLAIGVYNGYVSGSKLMSLSGVLPTKMQTRATFRTRANANGSNWMLWNYWHWKLLKEMTFLVLKSFDGQMKLGRGGHAYDSNTTGVTNAMGMFAGDISGTTSAMKCFIEDWWGSQIQFIDDFINNAGTVWVGQNAVPGDTTADKTSFAWGNTSSGWQTTILQTDLGWGLGTDNAGDKTKGLCDYQNSSTSANRVGYVGDTSLSASGGDAGPSFLKASNLDDASKYQGARLAFVFDE